MLRTHGPSPLRLLQKDLWTKRAALPETSAASAWTLHAALVVHGVSCGCDAAYQLDAPPLPAACPTPTQIKADRESRRKQMADVKQGRIDKAQAYADAGIVGDVDFLEMIGEWQAKHPLVVRLPTSHT